MSSFSFLATIYTSKVCPNAQFRIYCQPGNPCHENSSRALSRRCSTSSMRYVSFLQYLTAYLQVCWQLTLDTAGIAMYSSIMKTKTRPGDWLVILGAGGGLGHMYVNNEPRNQRMLVPGTNTCHTGEFKSLSRRVSESSPSTRTCHLREIPREQSRLIDGKEEKRRDNCVFHWVQHVSWTTRKLTF